MRFISEFWIPLTNERADLVAANGSLAAFELKSRRDRLIRLPRQAAAYSRVFDACTAVVDGRHLDETVQVLPEWWGISTISNTDNKICLIRPTGENPSLDPEALVRLLWRAELGIALVDLGQAVQAGESRNQLRDRLMASVSMEQLQRVVRSSLLVRSPEHARIPTKRYLEAGASS